MATGARTNGVVHKMVFELRYDYGNTYLDRCGATLNDILRHNPGWATDAMSPQSGVVQKEENNLTFSFGPTKLDLGQQQTEKVNDLLGGDDFGAEAERLTTTVVDRLQLEEFTRVGFRVWRLFEHPSLDDARQKVISMGVVSRQSLGSLDVGQLDELSFSLVCNFGNCMRRIALAPVQQNISVDPATVLLRLGDIRALPSRERKAEIIRRVRAERRVHYYPQFSVLVDVDSYVEAPAYPADITAAQFVASNYDWSRDFASRVVTA